MCHNFHHTSHAEYLYIKQIQPVCRLLCSKIRTAPSVLNDLEPNTGLSCHDAPLSCHHLLFQQTTIPDDTHSRRVFQILVDSGGLKKQMRPSNLQVPGCGPNGSCLDVWPMSPRWKSAGEDGLRPLRTVLIDEALVVGMVACHH